MRKRFLALLAVLMLFGGIGLAGAQAASATYQPSNVVTIYGSYTGRGDQDPPGYPTHLTVITPLRENAMDGSAPTYVNVGTNDEENWFSGDADFNDVCHYINDYTEAASPPPAPPVPLTETLDSSWQRVLNAKADDNAGHLGWIDFQSDGNLVERKSVNNGTSWTTVWASNTVNPAGTYSELLMRPNGQLAIYRLASKCGAPSGPAIWANTTTALAPAGAQLRYGMHYLGHYFIDYTMDPWDSTPTWTRLFTGP